MTYFQIVQLAFDFMITLWAVIVTLKLKSEVPFASRQNMDKVKRDLEKKMKENGITEI